MTTLQTYSSFTQSSPSSSLASTSTPTTIPISSTQQSAKSPQENLKTFGIYHVGELDPSAIARRNQSLKKDVWLYPNTYLDYSALIQSKKLGISSEQLQEHIEVFFPPLKISALDFCQFIRHHLGIVPLIGGSTVGHCLFGHKNNDLDFKIIFNQKEKNQNPQQLLHETYCDYILQLLQTLDIPLNYKDPRVRDLVKTVYLYTNLPIFNESRTQCEAVFTNLGHDLMCIINPEFRWYLTTYDRFLLSLEDNAIYYHSPQHYSTEEEIEKDLRETSQLALSHLKNKRYIVEQPRQTHNLFVRLIHAGLKEFTIETPSTIIPIALELLEKEYNSNASIFIKRVHSLLEKFNEDHNAIDLLLISVSLLQKIKDPRQREQWFKLAAESICTLASKGFSPSFHPKPQKDFSDLLLIIPSSKKASIKSKPPSFVPKKNDLELSTFILKYPELTSDFFNVLQGILLLEQERNPRAKQLKKLLQNSQSVEEVILQCATSWLKIKKFAPELAQVFNAIGLPSTYFAKEEQYLLQCLLKFLNQISHKIDFDNPAFEILKKMANELTDKTTLKHWKAKSDLQQCLVKMPTQERRTHFGWGEFIAVFSYRMRTTHFCPEERYIHQLNDRLEKLLDSPPNTEMRNAIAEALNTMVEGVLSKQPKNIRLLYELKRLSIYAKQIGLFTKERAESLDNQIIKIFSDIKADEHPDILLPFYQLWQLDSSFLSREPQFCSLLLGNILKHAASLAKTDFESNIDFLYICLDEALKTPFIVPHFESIHFIYQRLAAYAILKSDKESITKIGLLLITLLEKAKGINIPQGEIPKILKLIEALLQLSKKTLKAELQHYIGIKLIHYLAENYKIDASIQNTLLLKSVSIVLLDKSHEKTQRIYKKTIELICNQTGSISNEQTEICRNLTSNLDKQSSLKRRFIEFVANQNIIYAEEFLDLFKSKMDSQDYEQALHTLCKYQILSKKSELLKKAYENWQSMRFDPSSIMTHLSLGRMLFNAIQAHPMQENYHWLYSFLKAFIEVLKRHQHEIQSADPSQKNELSIDIEEMSKTISSLQLTKFEIPLQELWDASETMELINQTRSSLPKALIEKALKEGRIPKEALETIEKIPHGKLMNSEQVTWAIQLFNTIVNTPSYRDIHHDKILLIGTKLFQADPKLLSNIKKREFVNALNSKKLFVPLLNLFGECTQEFIEFCRENPRNWEPLFLAIPNCPALDYKIKLLQTFNTEIITQPKILSLFSQQLCGKLLDWIILECQQYPEDIINYSNLMNTLLTQVNFINSRDIRNQLESFIKILLEIDSLDAMTQVCSIYSKHDGIISQKQLDKNYSFKRDDFSIPTIIKILELLQKKPAINFQAYQHLSIQVLNNLQVSQHSLRKKQFTDIEDLILFLECSIDANKTSTALQYSQKAPSFISRFSKKSIILERPKFFVPERIFTIIAPLANGIAYGHIVFTSRLVYEIAQGHIKSGDPLINYFRVAVGLPMGSALLSTSRSLYVESKKPNSSVTIEKVKKLFQHYLLRKILSVGTCALIEVLARMSSPEKTYESWWDLIDVLAAFTSIAIFSDSEYYEEDLVAFYTSIFAAYLFRKETLYFV